uniref:Uncharacterized protein n=1 Tax=Periophthalmus magnuspinnatus TaxID=409849 RepID=A0A3B4AXK0_9GOBI
MGKEWKIKAAKENAPGLASLEWSPRPLGISCGSRLDIESINGGLTQFMPKAKTKLYHRRWFMLFLFSLLSACNSFMWLEYGIISNIFMRFYSVDRRLIVIWPCFCQQDFNVYYYNLFERAAVTNGSWRIQTIIGFSLHLI